MKFGSKGLDAPTIIGIVVAIIVAIVIIYILWSRGMLPFAPAADRNLCLSEILDACAGTKYLSNVSDGCTSFSDIAVKPSNSEVPSPPGTFGTGQEMKACGYCITLATSSGDCEPGGRFFQQCCNYIRGLKS